MRRIQALPQDIRFPSYALVWDFQLFVLLQTQTELHRRLNYITENFVFYNSCLTVWLLIQQLFDPYKAFV